jgi:hypothetical protein
MSKYNFLNFGISFRDFYFYHGQLNPASAALHTAVRLCQFSLLKLILLTSKNRLVTSSDWRRKLLITMIDVSFQKVSRSFKEMKIKRK